MSSAFQQAARPVQITTPLGPDKLIVRSYQGEEYVSGLFHYRVEAMSEDVSLSFSDIAGKAVTLQLPQSSGDIHYVNGVVGRFTESAHDGRFAYYSLDIYPWLWMLTMSADCAIYQNMTTPDIIKKVFSDLGFADYSDKLTGTYQPREFCVQYRETAFSFVSRLMEHEGIFYFFTHDSSSHKMVLADDSSAWVTATGLASARYTVDPMAWTSDDVVFECSIEQNITSGKFKADDYNFETPDTDLLASADGADTSRCVYDFPGMYSKQSDGETIASLRLSALEVPQKVLRGASRCRAFYAGCKFTLSGYFRDNANADYVVRVLRVNGDQDTYSNSFESFPESVNFRPPLLARTPVIPGTQAAVVTGKSGEEIWTDEYGRVKVQFFWDQTGKHDENSSCWIRVSQPWAGKQWGGMFLPRVGQEVIVSFLDGNPDRPVIVGTLYNASQTVPYTLPDDQTKSTIKSNSSKGGSGFNEFRFEDKAGSEELFIQAQKDMTVTVLNNQTTSITKDEALTVQGKRTITVTGKEAHTNQADYSSDVTGNFTLTVSGNLSIEASGSVSIKSGTSFTNKSGTDMTNDAGTTLSNKAAASQTVDGGGMLTLKGGMVKIN
jgi:type VI secretion system secreted protein VgrG